MPLGLLLELGARTVNSLDLASPFLLLLIETEIEGEEEIGTYSTVSQLVKLQGLEA